MNVRSSQPDGGAKKGIDLGACLFCRECASVCPKQTIAFTSDYRMAAGRREDLILFAESVNQSVNPANPKDSLQPAASMDGKAPDKAVPDGKDPLVLSAVGSGLATLAKWDPASDKQHWLLKTP